MAKLERKHGESRLDYHRRLYAHEESLGWTREVPALQRWYWHWSGEEDDAPLPTSVFLDGQDKPFVTCGQLGLRHAIDCEEYGGWWHPMKEPSTPKPHQRNFVGVGELERTGYIDPQ